MKQRMGTCTRFGDCKNADIQKKIPIMGGTCPLCGGDLKISQSPPSPLRRYIIIVFIIATLASGVWFAWTKLAYDEIVIALPNDLNNAEIQTPVDVALTEKVNHLAENRYVKKAIDLYYGAWKDQLTINFANAQKLKVTKHQYSWLYRMVSQAAEALGVELPMVYVVFSDSPNAYVTNVTQPILVIHSGLIEVMTPTELLFVIGHELGHIKFKHILAHEIVGISYNALNKLVPTETLRAIIANGILFTFLEWSRKAEMSADRLGMILVGSEEIASRALIKLISGLDDKFGPINIEAFIEQKSKAENDAFDLRQIPVLLKEVTSTHPFVGSRVEALYQYQNSPEYTKLFSSGDNHLIKLRLPKFE
jgi:Zn-dependent protease with chaperone function